MVTSIEDFATYTNVHVLGNSIFKVKESSSEIFKKIKKQNTFTYHTQ